MTTPRPGPERLRAVRARMRSAVASGSSGSSASVPSSRLEASTPAFAQTNPCRVSAMTRSPRRATTRAVSARPRPPPRRPPGTNRPSAFDTIFCVIATTSPSRAPAARSIGVTMAARSSPGTTSGMPFDSDDLQRRSGAHVASNLRAARATASATSSSTMIVSVDRDPDPQVAFDRSERARGRAHRSPSRAAAPGRRARLPRAVTSSPAAGISRSAIPASGAPPMIAAHAHRDVAPGFDRLADPRDRQDRADRDHGVRRREARSRRPRPSPPAPRVRAGPRPDPRTAYP